MNIAPKNVGRSAHIQAAIGLLNSATKFILIAEDGSRAEIQYFGFSKHEAIGSMEMLKHTIIAQDHPPKPVVEEQV